MKKLTPEPIREIAQGLWESRILSAAYELEIFTKISQGYNTVGKLASVLKIEKRPAEMLANACVALGILTKEKNRYHNTPLSEQFLVKGKPSYYGDFLFMFGGDWSYQDWGKLTEAILENKPMGQVIKERAKDLKKAKIFTKAMHNNALSPARALAKKVDFSSFKRLLDLGGGSGAYGIVLVKKYPNLRVTVFELPKVCRLADKFIKEARAEDRIETKIGDFFKDELPEGFDVVLLSQILHSFGPAKNQQLLKKVYQILPKRGMVIVNDFLLDEQKTGPKWATLFALNMLLQSKKGNSYTEAEIKSWLRETGFSKFKTVPLTGPHVAILGTKEKK